MLDSITKKGDIHKFNSLMKRTAFCIIIGLQTLTVSACSTAMDKSQAIQKNNAYATYYPASRGVVGVRYADGKYGYKTNYIRTYRDTDNKNFSDVAYKGCVDIVTLGLFSIFN